MTSCKSLITWKECVGGVQPLETFFCQFTRGKFSFSALPLALSSTQNRALLHCAKPLRSVLEKAPVKKRTELKLWNQTTPLQNQIFVAPNNPVSLCGMASGWWVILPGVFIDHELKINKSSCRLLRVSEFWVKRIAKGMFENQKCH